MEILLRIEKKLDRILKYQGQILAENLGTKRPRRSKPGLNHGMLGGG